MRIRPVRKFEQPREWPFTLGAVILKPLFFATTKPRWIDGTKLPASGGCIVVMNHLSHVDPLTAAHFTYDHGRYPRYLAKSGLFKNRLLGWFLRTARQIPVMRATREAVGAYDAAVAAVDAGECVVVYPEGTLTRDPDLWPMTGKSGAARIALATGCPVVPVGQWGAQLILPPYAKKPDLFPRKRITMKVGDPVDLDDLRAAAAPGEHPVDIVRQATDRIMGALTVLVADIRGEVPPTERFDMRSRGVVETGDPNRDRGDDLRRNAG